MSAGFSLMDKHIAQVREPREAGRLVLSRLSRGRSLIAAPSPSLKLVLEGEEVYEVDGRPHRVSAGEFLYVDAGADCEAILRSEAVGFCVTLPLPLTEECSLADLLFGRTMVFSTRTSGFGRTLEFYGRSIAGRPELGASLSEEIIDSVMRCISEPLGESRSAIEALDATKLSTRRELFQRLERARGYLHSDCGRAIPLAELAAMVGMSQFHMARYFKLAFGEAPIAYHRRLRLDRAAMLLAGGHMTVAEAADATGYSDAVALSHAFRRQFGIPPQKWTERMLN